MTTQREEPGARTRAGVDRSDLISGALSIVVGLAIIPYARSMPEISEGLPGPGLFPGIIGGLFVFFGSALVIKALVVARRGGVPDEAGDGAAPASHEKAAVPVGLEPGPTDVEPVAADAVGVVHASLAATARARWVNAAVILGAILVYILAAELLGFIITMFVLMTVIMLVLRSRVLAAVLTAAGVTALLYVVFEIGLLVQLPDGILG